MDRLDTSLLKWQESVCQQGIGYIKLAATATATTVAKGVAENIQYFNERWLGNLTIALAVNSDLVYVNSSSNA